MCNTRIMEDPADGHPSSATEKRTLHVFWSKREAKLFYTIYSTNTEEEGDWNQSSVVENSEEIKYFWKTLNDFTNEIIVIGNPSDKKWQNISMNLKGKGEKLFNTFIPSELAQRIKKWKSGGDVRVSTNEQWIPWELMHDGQDFLGNKFIFTRYPRRSQTITNSNTNRPTSQGLKQVRKIVNVVGGNLEETYVKKASELFNLRFNDGPIIWFLLREINFMASILFLRKSLDQLSEFNKIDIKLLDQEGQSLSDLVAVLEEADILHFTGHAHLEPPIIQISSNTSLSDNLGIDTITQLPLKAGSFVFVNSCHSNTTVQTTFSQFSSFGWEFYQKGADVFIGTLGIVPAKYAISFAKDVYKHLLFEAPKFTIGNAVDKAQKLAASKHNNYFWLLYCIYGDPDFCFETKHLSIINYPI